MEFTRKIVLAFTGALFLYCAPVSFADHTWGTYHWARQNNPFTLQVIDSVTDFWWTEMDAALTEWAKAESLELQTTSTENDETTRLNCPMVAGKVRVCNGLYGSTGWLGLTSIGVDSSGHVDRGVSRINDSYSSYWSKQAMKNHVMCHEIGHLFGLGHTSEDGSSQATCMDYSSSTSSQWPNAHDYDLLDNTIYAHLDNHNSYDDSLDNVSGSTTGDTTGGTTDGTTGGDTGGTTDTGCSGKGADKDCNGIPDSKETGGTTGGSGTCELGKGNDKNCNGIPDNKESGSNYVAGSWVAYLPPLGTRVAQTQRGEVWVSSREDGGLWIHHVYLAEPNANPGIGVEHDHADHQH